MSDFEYDIGLIVPFVGALSQLGGTSVKKDDVEFMSALKAVSDLLAERLPVGVSMADVMIIAMSDIGILQEFVDGANEAGLSFTDFAKKKRSDDT